jgi:RHS repeat-associated protein
MGLWIEVTAPAWLNVMGTPPESTVVRLCRGWNLIGYPLAMALPVSDALASIEGRYDRVFAWDPADADDPWAFFAPSVPNWANDLKMMKPGQGYWVHATEGTSLVSSMPSTPPMEVPGFIAGPENRSTVSGQVPITLAEGTSLQLVTVDYWPANDVNAVQVLVTGVEGVGGETLATLDTTLLTNGSYVIRVAGTDENGDWVASGVMVTVEGEYKPGRVHFTITDLTVPVVGLPIVIGRTYDSLERNEVGDFGYGWSLAIGSPKVEVDPDHNVTLTMPDGRRVTFYFAPQSIWGFLLPRYTPGPGVYGTLLANGCGLVVVAGGRHVCFPGGPYEESIVGYTYTDPYGRIYTMGADGTLRSIKDLNDNVLTFSADGITSSAGGLHVAFERDEQSRITAVIDPMGNVYGYGYDAAGDLVSVALPGVDEPVRYTYDAQHFFLTATDPRGNSIIADTYYPDGRLMSETDALGHTFQYAYDLEARMTVVTNPDGGIVTTVRDEQGNVVSQTDPLSRTTRYSYDDNNNVLSETDALEHTTLYTYDSNGNQTSVTNPLGQISYTAYNQYGGPTSSTDAFGNVQTVSYDAHFLPASLDDSLGTLAGFQYDSSGNLLAHTDANSKMTAYMYDTCGNKLSETDPLGNATTYTYDQLGHALTRTDPLGNTTQYSYDALGRVLTETDPEGHVTSYEYDSSGNQTALVDPLGRRTSYVYDGANRLTQITYPDGTSESYTYDWRDNVLTETDQEGHTTRYEYDLAGQLLTITFAEGTVDASSIHYSYDAAGRMVQEIDPRGYVTTYGYDSTGNLLSVTDPLSHTTSYTYDKAGRRISTVDANQHETRHTYDTRGRLILTTYPDGTTSQQQYDGMGRRLSSADQAGQTTFYTYDDSGRLLSVGDALSQTTTYSYDAVGNLLSITDANDHTTSYDYDSSHRRVARTLPLGMSESYQYDAVGNLIGKTDFSGRTTTYSYDSLNRLTEKTPDPGLSEPTIRFSYTPAGRRASMEDASGTTTYTYDALGRLHSKATPYGTLTYAYDAAGNLLSMRSSNADGTSVDYIYDALNRLTTVTDNRLAAGTTMYSYDTVGNLAGHAYPNGVQTTYTYDHLNRLTSLTASKMGANLAFYAYTLGPAGNRLSVAELSGRTVNYGYDALYRLTDEIIASDPIAANNGTINYTYDAVGNRLSRDSTVAAVPSATHAYDANDRLTSDTYDVNGNTTASSGDAYEYDFENRLTKFNDGAVTIVYDGDGNRVSMTVDGVTTNYLVDDRNPTGYAQVVEEIVDGAVQRTYAYGHDRISQNQWLDGAWAVSFYGYDGRGSVRYLTDASGAMANTYTYDAFGNLIHSTGNIPNVYTYAGEPYDSTSGLTYLRARYLSPAMGRFWTMDPCEGCASVPLSLNRYLYAHADPVNNLDPSGMFVCTSTKEWGNRIHKEIGADFVSKSPLSRLYDTTINQILQSPVPGGGQRPDLVEYWGHTLSPPWRYPEVFEIKPVWSVPAGVFQLGRYLLTLNVFDPQHRIWIPGTALTYVPPPVIPIQPGVIALVYPPAGGLVVYCPLDFRNFITYADVMVLIAYLVYSQYRVGQAVLQPG